MSVFKESASFARLRPGDGLGVSGEWSYSADSNYPAEAAGVGGDDDGRVASDLRRREAVYAKASEGVGGGGGGGVGRDAERVGTSGQVKKTKAKVAGGGRSVTGLPLPPVGSLQPGADSNLYLGMLYMKVRLSSSPSLFALN